jgi:3-oxoacyl-[acyl-carrier-protein] synthase-3
MINSIITGTGMYVPDFVLDNQMFNQMIETSDEWITTRTGIKERRVEQEKYNYEMIGEACKSALENSGLSANQIDMIIVSTVTPDFNSPSAACLVQKYIGAENAASFDISAACAGFVFLLDIADLYIKSGKAKNIIIASGDITTRFADYFDRANCILFGDGSGAAVISACESEERRGILTSFIKSEADGNKAFSIQIPLYKPSEIFDKQTKQFKGNINKVHNGYLTQNGREVYQFVVRILPPILEKVTADAGIKISDLDYIILHQANKRILEYLIDKYKLDPAKVPMTIEKYGNTSSSTVPILLHELNAAGKLKKGDLIALSGFGSGLVYGAAVVKW